MLNVLKNSAACMTCATALMKTGVQNEKDWEVLLDAAQISGGSASEEVKALQQKV
jgi:hypothetical protein